MFKLSTFINNTSSKIKNNTFLLNPFYVSLIIISLIFLIIYIVCYNEIEFSEDSGLNLFIKSAFFSYIAALTVIFLSINNIENTIKEKYRTKSDISTINLLNSDIENNISPIKN